MARVKRGVVAKARHKKVLRQAKGYYGARSRTYKVAKQAGSVSVNSGLSGLRESMPPPD